MNPHANPGGLQGTATREAVQPWLFGPIWIPVRDANPSALAIFHRHYSYAPYRDGRRPLHFVGPGEKMVLLTPEASALFVWRKFISGDGQQGVNCAVFRNEGPRQSSDLIREASRLAWQRWPGQRLYTYVNPLRIRSTNPGYCFIAAGWRRCGVTKWNRLIILECAGETLPSVQSLAHQQELRQIAEGEA